MLTSFPWSIAKRIGSKSDLTIKLGTRKKLKNTYILKSDKSMDGSSIITQVNRDEDVLSNGHTPKEDEVNSKTKKVKRRSLFSSLRCCFGQPRKRGDLQKNNKPDAWNSIDNKKNHVNNVATDGHCEEPNGNATQNGGQKSLLPKLNEKCINKKCAIIDLDETLVHSSFKPISNADFIVPVEIDGTVHQVYVLKRPHVDQFLQRMGEMYECVLFTASLSKYADPVADLLDQHQVFSSRLFRDSCVFHRGNYVKDLSRLGRDLNKIIIIDNSPASYIFHPDNAVPVMSWFDDTSDQELVNLIPYLEMIAESDDVYTVLRQSGFTSQANETTTAIQMQLNSQMRGTLAQQSIITQVQQTDSSEDETESLSQDERDHEER